MVWVGATRANKVTFQIISIHGHTQKLWMRGNISLVGFQEFSVATSIFRQDEVLGNLIHLQPSRGTEKASFALETPNSALVIDAICRAENANHLRPS